MIIGIPKEIKTDEYRVALIPSMIGELVAQGHEVLVDTCAGQGAGIRDEDYAAAGARIAKTADENGEDVIIAGSVTAEDAKKQYPQGWKEPKPYIRIVPQADDVPAAKVSFHPQGRNSKKFASAIRKSQFTRTRTSLCLSLNVHSVPRIDTSFASLKESGPATRAKSAGTESIMPAGTPSAPFPAGQRSERSLARSRRSSGIVAAMPSDASRHQNIAGLSRVLAPDLIGYGPSPPPSSSYGIAEEVSHLLGLLDCPQNGTGSPRLYSKAVIIDFEDGARP